MNRILLVLTVCALLGGCAHRVPLSDSMPPHWSASERSATAHFRAFLDGEWEWAMREFPDWATSVGDLRYNDRWTDNSEAAVLARQLHERDVLARLEAMDRAALPPEERLNYDLYLRNAKDSVEGQRFPGEMMPISQMGGVHQDIADTAQWVPRARVKDLEDFIARLNSVPFVVDNAIEWMRKGLAAGITPPRAVLGNVGDAIRSQAVDSAEDSPIFQAVFTDFAESIPASEHARLRAAGAAAIDGKVLPAYRKLLDFWTSEYYPNTRETIGLSALPDGAAWYAHDVRRQTTTDLTPEEIHTIGLREVARIRSEMEALKASTGFTGSLAEFFEFLRTDPQFFHTSAEDLLKGYRDIAKRADAELPKLFRTLPRLPYGVLPVPAYSEKTQTTAYYLPGSLAAGRPGYFFANTYNLPARPKWEMEALTLHEAVPGHHFQIAIAQEQGDLPRFRQHGHYTAFVEGWGLYAESLGESMGFYRDPYSRFGQLTYEMWRSIRLVVDTGIHAKGWTRAQAIAFFAENSSKTPHDIQVEVDRYIVWPGQALAYKIGLLKLKELRALAERELGERFDLRDFHDMLLVGGPLPLDVLQARAERWIADRKP